MAVTLDLKIKPYTDDADVKKVANELSSALSKELDKHSGSKDKRIMSLNMQVKRTIQTIDDLQKKLEDLSNESYEPKYAKDMESILDKIVDVRTKLQDTQTKQAGSATPNLYDGVIESLKSQLSSLNNQYNELQEAESYNQQNWVNEHTNAQQKIRQQLDATTDRAKVQYLQYQELGSKAVTVFRGLLPVLGALHNGVARTLASVPQALNRIVGLVSRLATIIHLPKISSGIKDILRGLKRGALLIMGLTIGGRGLYSLINKLRSMIMGGFKDIYNQDKQFKTQIDTIKQKILDIQVAFAETLMPVIQMALPYIKQLLDWVMSLLGVLQRFISTVTGIAAYTKAIKGLGGAAKDANKQLSKLDELNNYTTGGGGLTPNAGSIGDPKKIEDWFKFTRNIIDEIEKMLRGIPWEKAYKEADKFGYAIAQILNAIFKPSFWNAVGMTLGGALNTILHFFSTLGNTLNFVQIGKSFVEAIRGFFDMFDWSLLSDTLITWADGFWTIIKTILTDRDNNGQTLAERIVSMITNSLSQIDWPKVYEKVREVATTLSDTLNQLIDPEMASEIGKTLGGIVMSIVEFAITFFNNTDWDKLGESIANGINGIFEQLDASKLASAINSISHALITVVKKVIEVTDWSEIGSDIKTLLEEIDWKALLTVLLPFLAPTLLSVLKNIISVVWSLFKTWLTTWITSHAGFVGFLVNKIAMLGTALTGIVSAIIAALGGYQIGNGIAQIVALISGDMESFEEAEEMSIPALIIKMLGLDWDSSRWEEVWSETFDNIGLDKLILWIEDRFQEIRDLFTDTTFGELLSNIFEGSTLDTIITDWTSFYDSLVELATLALSNLLTTWTTTLTDIINKIGEWWDNDVAPMFDLPKWTGLFGTIKTALKQIWDEAVEFWKTNISDWYDNYVVPWFDLQTWIDLLSIIKTAFSDVFTGAANIAIDCINKVLEAVEGLINNGAVKGFNWLIEKANNFENVNIPTISGAFSLPKIPALASGTVIPPSMHRFLAELGDNNQDTEVVSPLSTMKEAFIEAMMESGFTGGGDINVTLEVDGRVLAKTLVKQNEMSKKTSGKPLFT